MKDLKALEILKKLQIDVKKDIEVEGIEVFGYIDTSINEAIAELEAYITNNQGIKRRLDNSLQTLNTINNRSCMNCKHNEITICKKLPSIDWSFEPTNDFYCSKWEQS